MQRDAENRQSACATHGQRGGYGDDGQAAAFSSPGAAGANASVPALSRAGGRPGGSVDVRGDEYATTRGQVRCDRRSLDSNAAMPDESAERATSSSPSRRRPPRIWSSRSRGSIPATQTWTITLSSPLPAITSPVTIDGYSRGRSRSHRLPGASEFHGPDPCDQSGSLATGGFTSPLMTSTPAATGTNDGRRSLTTPLLR